KFRAAFCVLKRVRKLGFRKTNPIIICFHNASLALGEAFSFKASFTICDKLSTSPTEKNFFIYLDFKLFIFNLSRKVESLIVECHSERSEESCSIRFLHSSDTSLRTERS